MSVNKEKWPNEYIIVDLKDLEQTSNRHHHKTYEIDDQVGFRGVSKTRYRDKSHKYTLYR